ncbi:hypothetical protein B5V89_13745 [Heyndrickxia sporothermodurans]|uniref:hydrolase n=1 Tax=Heyndrickxia sporothermodurans TaxID=46224 RepID=UPI000D3591B5|nr:hydrolase [Heyndrickxia sporothermodurans]PTY77688.1 hypothetical protein B5V89_13745 [Heyndrickxia sporothermodurans]
MESNSRTYYIDITNGEILDTPIETNQQFKIIANHKELTQLKELFKKLYAADLETYARAHIPFLEYHHDSENHKYDQILTEVYQMIYQLGNEEARQYIIKNGILNDDDPHLDQSKGLENFK